MAGLFSDHHNHPHGGIRVLYFVANDFRQVGLPILDLLCCLFALWPVSNQNDLDLL